MRAKFPALPPLPDRPRLDQLVDEAGLSLVYDEAERAYRSPTRAADTTGLASRLVTSNTRPQPAARGRRTCRAAPDRERRRAVVPRARRGRRPHRSCHRRATRPVRRRSDRRDPGADRRHAGAGRRGRAPVGHSPGRRRGPSGQPGRRRAVRTRPAQPPRRRSGHRCGGHGRARGQPPGAADRDRAARPVRPPDHTEQMGRPGHPPTAGDLAARPATGRQPGRRHRPAALPLAAPGQFFRFDADWIDVHGRIPTAEGAS